ncbi:hypothetical protein KUV46_04065 [Thalassovita mediterranea]|nr:hypothetical protein KUV46_04065 [Thalassovita mediterranea]
MSAKLDFFDSEQAILRRLQREYEEKGYEFVAQPSRSLLPEFLERRGVDAIAFKPYTNVAIEVVHSSGRSHSKRLQELAKSFESQPEWTFKTYYVSDFPDLLEELEISDLDLLRSAVDTARNLRSAEFIQAAFAWAWIVFEATYQKYTAGFEGARHARVTSPTKIISTLEEMGEISYTSARHLRVIANKRNALFHGALNTSIRNEDIDRLMSVLETMLRQFERETQ